MDRASQQSPAEEGKTLMSVSIALGINFWNDVAPLRGLLEVGSRYFDNIFAINAGPGGEPSNDGSIELLESFGVIRTRLLHECGCAWCMILDCDERFTPQLNVLECEGTEAYPASPEPKLTVTVKRDVIDQGAHVKNLISNPDIMAIRATRRHWFDYAMRRPTQNWYGPGGNRDHQLRIVRNLPEIGYQKNRVMHERLVDTRTGKDPVFAPQDENGGPFIDHHHMFFRRTQPGKKEFNEANYARLSKGEKMEVR
jgi:hypothetical protein